MKFLVIIPPYVIDGGAAVWPSKALLPVGPLSIAAELREVGHEVACVDLVFVKSWKETLLQAYRSQAFDAVLLSCHTVRNISVCRKIVAALPDPKPHIILGGNVCSDLGIDDFFKLGLKADTVMRGYAHGLTDSIVNLERGDIAQKRSELVSRMALPAIDLLSDETQKQYLKASEGKYPMVATSFGCAWACDYCSAKMDSRLFERCTVNVVLEIERALKLGYGHIWAVDNIVTHNEDTCLLFDLAVAAFGMKWSGMTRPELLAGGSMLFPKLKALSEIAVGIETVSTSDLQFFHRGAKSDYEEKCLTGMNIARDCGVATNAFVMLDYPGATEEQFWKMYGFLISLPLDTISWSFYNPPAKQLLIDSQLSAEDFGFYRWPLKCSNIPAQRVVQQAMILSGTWWDPKMKLDASKPFFNNSEVFGVGFESGLLFQSRGSRSVIGNIWEEWEMQ